MTLELITGPMFSGKTSELIRRLRLAAAQGERVCAGKPAIDRDQGWLTSLAGPRLPASTLDDVDAIERLAVGASVVGVDEVQFLDAPAIYCLAQLADEGPRVIAAGLDLDYRGIPFPSVKSLAAQASSITTLTGVCARCGAAATRSQRLLDGQPAASTTPTVLVGGPELYEPRCDECHEVR